MSLPIIQPQASSQPPRQAVEFRPHPFLHFGEEKIYHPILDQTLEQGTPGFRALTDIVQGRTTAGEVEEGVSSVLRHDGWLIPIDFDATRQFKLKYISFEAIVRCNQACYFCPVSVAPREDHVMPMDDYRRILAQLSAYADTVEGLFMISYNEPTADPLFVDRVRAIHEAGLPPAVLTNGSGLTPKRVDALMDMGGLRFLSFNLSTLDRERYAKDRGGDHLPVVLRNVDYVKDLELAPEMHIAVLGTGDDVHRRDYEAICERFAGSRLEPKFYTVNDRAGKMPIGLNTEPSDKKLCGCDYVGSRPLQHIHITPRGDCILCCQDYDERYIVGNLYEQTVEEVLTGPEMAKLRRWIYGIEEAPDDFICRHCVNALTV